MTNATPVTLFLCPIEWRNTSALEPQRPFVAVELELGRDCLGANSAIVAIGDTDVRYHVASDGGILRTGSASARAIFSDIGLAAAFSADEGLVGNYVPLFLYARQDAVEACYTCTTLHGGKLLFLNSGTRQAGLGAGEDRALLEQLNAALDFHRRSYLFLNNHNNFNFYKKYRPDDEIEHKYNLASGSNIWAIAVELLRAGERSELPGFTLHLAHPLTHWDFDNHMFEIREPAAERGYISFIPMSSGKHILKRKVYGEDTLIRKEFRQREVDIATTFEDHLRAHFPELVFHKLPAFRRVRYDVDFESLDTGNIYSVMFDRSTIMDFDCDPLVQCEVEYIQTRSSHQPTRVLDDLEQVNSFIHAFLTRQGAQPTPTYYSKLTYLKDAVATVQR